MANSFNILANLKKLLTGLFLVAVPVFGSWQSSYATEHEIAAKLTQPVPIVPKAAIAITGYSWFAHFDKAFLKLKT